MRNEDIKAGVIGTLALFSVGCVVARNVFPDPFWLIARVQFLVLAGVFIGYCAYKGTMRIENAVSPSDLAYVFDDTFSRNHVICPKTGDMCLDTKCAPGIMQTYGMAKTRYLLTYCETPNIWSFGVQWLLFSASSVCFLRLWEQHTGLKLIPFGAVFAAIPVVSYFLFDYYGKSSLSCPNAFSMKIPPIDDVAGFNNAMEHYCVYLYACSLVMQTAATTYSRFKSIAFYISFALICFAIITF